MTPRQLDVDTATQKLLHMRELLELLANYDGVTGARLIEDLSSRLIVERILTQLVNRAVAINTQVAAALAGRAPSDSKTTSKTETETARARASGLQHVGSGA